MPPVISENSIEWLNAYRIQLDRHIVGFFDERYTDTPKTPAERDFEGAMKYAVLGGGKRLRPILAMIAYEECSGQPSDPLIPGLIGIEFLHCYTLVHDDLPCMDNDTLRRWQPTVWNKYGEYQAVLVGDALQSLGFESLASLRNMDIMTRITKIMGDLGVVRGQIKDMGSGKYQNSLESILRLHEQKTGLLIRGSLEIGASLAEVDEKTIDSIGRYGTCIGLLFQIRDDVLDYEGSVDTIGKTTWKDIQGNKGIVSAIGIEQAKKLLDTKLEEAVTIAKRLSSSRLAEIAHFIATRKN